MVDSLHKVAGLLLEIFELLPQLMPLHALSHVHLNGCLEAHKRQNLLVDLVEAYLVRLVEEDFIHPGNHLLALLNVCALSN